MRSLDRRRVRAALPCLALAVALSPFPLRAEPPAPVARAGGVTISRDGMNEMLAGLSPADRAALDANPQNVQPLLSGRLLDLLVLDDAAKSGFAQRPEVVRRLERAREALLIELYLNARIDLAPDYPTPAEVQAFYDGHKDAFIPPERLHLAQIFIQDQSAAASNPKAEEAARKAKAKGADFAALARELSDARDEAARGGDLGWVGAPTLAPEIGAEAAKAKKGAVLGPIRTKQGWHIVMMRDRTPAGTRPLPLDQIKATLAPEMRRRKIAEQKRAVVEALLKANPPTIDMPAVADVLAAKPK